MEIKKTYEIQQEVWQDLNALDHERYIAEEKGKPLAADWDARWQAATDRQAKAQDAVGGRVFLIPNENLDKLGKKIARFVKKAEKNGSPVPSFKITSETETKIIRKNGENVQYIKTFVVAAGEPPKIAGWTFVATIDHLSDAGNVLRTAPGTALNLSAYWHVDAKCDHCNKIRSRKDTYIVQHENGEVKQVGRTCLSDFIATLTPERVVSFFTFIDDIEAAQTSGEPRGEKVLNTREFLTHAALTIRNHGWVSRQNCYDYGGVSSGSRAETNLLNKARNVKDRVTGAPLWADPEDIDADTADEAIAWVTQIDPKDDFEHNLKVVASSNCITYRSVGIATYIIQAHKRYVEGEVQRKVQEERAKDPSNTHVGEVKDRLELILTPTKVIPRSSEYYYGPEVTYITTLEDDEGHTFVWFGSYELKIGVAYEGRWTIKDHTEWKDLKQTQINRPAKLEAATEQGE